MVAYFNLCIERVGAFVQLCQHHQDQFSVDWLCEFGVPVWYCWGCQETRASQTDARLASVSRSGPVPESFINQGPRTRTAKNRKKPVVTGSVINTLK